MKKYYNRPETLVIEYSNQCQLLSASDANTNRNFDGSPDTDEYGSGGVPTDITNTSDTPDPFGGHGQGTGGNTTRAKGSIIFWDDEEDELW